MPFAPLASASPGAALAFVHGLDARDGDGTTFLDQLLAQWLGRRHVVRPRVAVTKPLPVTLPANATVPLLSERSVPLLLIAGE